MKCISWNVNGIRACITKGFEDRFRELDADIFCIQETKCQQGQVELELPGYHQYWNYANRRGYSGTAVFTKKEPISVKNGIGIEEHDKEGRVITLEFKEFYFVTVYTPNSQSELRRLEYRMEWERDFLAYLLKLQESKPVIWWSYRFKAREKNAGWRIDYFIISPSLKEKLQGAAIHTEIMGSDHCPIELDIDLK